MPDLALTNIARSVSECVEGRGRVRGAILTFLCPLFDKMANYDMVLVHDGLSLAQSGTATRQNS